MEQRKGGGALPVSEFAYTDQSCAELLTEEQRQQASPYRIKGSQRLSQGGDPDTPVDMLAVK